MVFLNFRISASADALAAILKEYDCHVPIGIQDTAILKQWRSYWALIWVVVIFIAMTSKPDVALIFILGVSLRVPDRLIAWVKLFLVSSLLFRYA